MCIYTDRCIEEKGRTSAIGRWRKNHLRIPDLVLGERHSGSKEEEIEREEGGALLRVERQ